MRLAPRQLMGLAAALIVLMGLAYGVVGFLTAEDRVKAICAGLRPGMSTAQAMREGAAQGLKGALPTSGVGFIVEGRTFGRFGCRLVVRQNVVESVEVHFAD